MQQTPVLPPTLPALPRAAQAQTVIQPWVINEADVPRTGEQVEAMRIRGPIAVQLHDLTPGTEINLTP